MSIYANCILFNLAKAYQRVQGVFKSRFQAYGLTPVQLLVLEFLFETEGVSAGEIGKQLVLDSATLSGVLDRMAEAGWITKNTADEDKRVLRIHLTPKALQMKDILLKENEDANGEVLSSLSVEERLLLERILRDLRR